MDIWGIVSIVLGGVGVLLGGKLLKIRTAIKEIADVPTTINAVLSDNKITADELKRVLKECREAITSIKNLF